MQQALLATVVDSPVYSKFTIFGAGDRTFFAETMQICIVLLSPSLLHFMFVPM